MPIVSEAWVDGSLAAGSLADVGPYLLTGGGGGGGGAAAAKKSPASKASLTKKASKNPPPAAAAAAGGAAAPRVPGEKRPDRGVTTPGCVSATPARPGPGSLLCDAGLLSIPLAGSLSTRTTTPSCSRPTSAAGTTTTNSTSSRSWRVQAKRFTLGTAGAEPERTASPSKRSAIA